MEQEAKKKFLIDLLFLSAIIGIGVIVFRFLLGYLLPFVAAGLVAWAVQRPSAALEKRIGMHKRYWAPALAILLYLAVLSAGCWLLFRLAMLFGSLLDELPHYTVFFSGLLTELQDKLFNRFHDMPDEFFKAAEKLYNSALDSLVQGVTGFLSGTAGALAKKAPSFFISALVAAVASCYIAKDFVPLCRFLKQLCGEERYARTLRIKEILTDSVFRFIKGYLFIMLMTLTELCVGLTILGIKNALLIGIIISLIDILPVLGTGTVLIPWAIFELLAKRVPLGLGLTVLYLVILIVRNFAEPRMIGKQMGIHPLFTLLIMFVGLRLFGVVGMVVLPIVLIVVVKYYKEDV